MAVRDDHKAKDQSFDLGTANSLDLWGMAVERKQERERAIEAVLITDAMEPNVCIRKRIANVTSEVAYEMINLNDEASPVLNFQSGRPEAVDKAVSDARATVLSELKGKAHALVANAVIDVDWQHGQIGDSGWSMVMLVASGTAVVIE